MRDGIGDPVGLGFGDESDGLGEAPMIANASIGTNTVAADTERARGDRATPCGASAGGPIGQDDAAREASRVLHRFLWLRRAPGANVAHQVRSVIAKQIRGGLTADEITRALVTRLTPADALGREVPAVREVLRGVWSDRKAADPAGRAEHCVGPW